MPTELPTPDSTPTPTETPVPVASITTTPTPENTATLAVGVNTSTQVPHGYNPFPAPDDIFDAKGVPMRHIPAGEFFMGSNNYDYGPRPRHLVSLDAYDIDKYEVTNVLYAACVQAEVCIAPKEITSNRHGNYYGTRDFANYPVIYVDWYMADSYCSWRGARLPSEAEWEKAARGGLVDKLYPWGDTEPNCSLANFSSQGSCIGDANSVGSYAPNGYRVYEMAGNVWEWVNDWMDGYPEDAVTNPQGPATGSSKVFRGGSWSLNAASFLGVAVRNSTGPGFVNIALGFRCARSQ
jgi:formylglycine-generating enzyme required for sulfatase activity